MVRWKNAPRAPPVVLVVVPLLLVALSGCVDEPTQPSRTDPGTRPDPTGTADAPADCPEPPRFDAVVPGCPLAPRPLTGGLRLTYAAAGVWDLSPSVEVIVVPQTDGYLFAAGDRTQVYDAAVWWRQHYGPHNDALNLLGADGTERPLFDWPLYHNKTWPYQDTEVTAVEEEVPIPGGTERGFHMTRSSGDSVYSWTYAPSVGYLTTFTYGDDTWTYESLRLDKVDAATEWVWFERGPYFFSGAHDGPLPVAHAGTWDIPPGHDELILIGLGDEGTRGTLHPADATAAPWAFEGGPLWTWAVTALAATEGPWTYTFTRPDDNAYVGVEAIAVTWTGP